MHPNKALRKRALAVLRAAAPQIEVGGNLYTVTVVENAPRGAWIPDADLPGVYAYVRGETIEYDSHVADQRTYLIDFVLQAKGSSDTASDQVDDMQLAVEEAFVPDRTLGGLCLSFRAVGSEVYRNQGEFVFAARRLTYAAEIMVDPDNPDIPDPAP